MIKKNYRVEPEMLDLNIDSVILALERNDVESALCLAKSIKTRVESDIPSIDGFSWKIKCDKCEMFKSLKEKIVNLDNYIMLADVYHIEDEKELSNVLCKYMYDHLSPFDEIHYSFEGGLNLVKDKNHKPTMRITKYGFECFGGEDND